MKGTQVKVTLARPPRGSAPAYGSVVREWSFLLEKLTREGGDGGGGVVRIAEALGTRPRRGRCGGGLGRAAPSPADAASRRRLRAGEAFQFPFLHAPLFLARGKPRGGLPSSKQGAETSRLWQPAAVVLGGLHLATLKLLRAESDSDAQPRRASTACGTSGSRRVISTQRPAAAPRG